MPSIACVSRVGYIFAEATGTDATATTRTTALVDFRLPPANIVRPRCGGNGARSDRPRGQMKVSFPPCRAHQPGPPSSPDPARSRTMAEGLRSLLRTHTAAWAGSRRTSALGVPARQDCCCCSSSAQPNGVCDIQLLHLARQACHVKGVARRSRSTISHDAPCNPAQPSSRSCEARSSARRPGYCAPDVLVASGSPRLRRAATAARNPN